jgi:hypothetical protein
VLRAASSGDGSKRSSTHSEQRSSTHSERVLACAGAIDFANALVTSIRHPLAFIHMPVPIARTDDAFPLSLLKLPPGTTEQREPASESPAQASSGCAAIMLSPKVRIKGYV